MESRRARELWTVFEPVHAITYFAPECVESNRALGLKGFWMGYFATRAAPLGPVGPGPVAAAFFGFRPSMVARALPDAWRLATPDAVLDARRRSAATALRRLCTDVDEHAAALVPVLARVVSGAEGTGRVLFSANRDLPAADDPVEELWQLATCLREHRGDGHVATLCARGLAPCQALVLFARSVGIDDELLRANRGWSEEDWGEAAGSLRAQGLLGAHEVTERGGALRDEIESTTDTLAAALFSEATPTELASLAERFGQLAADIASRAAVPYPNPMGLPPPPPRSPTPRAGR